MRDEISTAAILRNPSLRRSHHAGASSSPPPRSRSRSAGRTKLKASKGLANSSPRRGTNLLERARQSVLGIKRYVREDNAVASYQHLTDVSSDLDPDGNELTFEFAVVLHNTVRRLVPERRTMEDVRASQTAVVHDLLSSRVNVTFLDNFGTDTSKVCLLLRATEGRMLQELRDDELSHGIRRGADPMNPGAYWTTEAGGKEHLSALHPKDRLAILNRILTKAREEGGAGVTEQRAVVHAVFPLQDYQLNERFMREFGKKVVLNEWYVHRIREYYGEEVAFYFAFNRLYTKALLWPALCGFGVYLTKFISNRSSSSSSVVGGGGDGDGGGEWSGTYLMAIAVYGYLVAALWAPLVVKYWTRRNRELLYAWGLRVDQQQQHQQQQHQQQQHQQQQQQHLFSGDGGGGIGDRWGAGSRLWRNSSFEALSAEEDSSERLRGGDTKGTRSGASSGRSSPRGAFSAEDSLSAQSSPRSLSEKKEFWRWSGGTAGPGAGPTGAVRMGMEPMMMTRSYTTGDAIAHEDANPQFRGEWVTKKVRVPLTEEGKFAEQEIRVLKGVNADRCKRMVLSLFMLLFLVAAVVSMSLLTFFYGQWYVSVKMAPTCPTAESLNRHATAAAAAAAAAAAKNKHHGGGGSSSSNSMSNVGGDTVVPPVAPTEPWLQNIRRLNDSSLDEFLSLLAINDRGCYDDTSRYVAIVFQGVFFAGVVMALWTLAFRLSEWFTRLENHRTLSQRDKYFVAKCFTFTWVYYYSYYLVISLLYVPFGAKAQRWIKEHIGFGYIAQWNPEVIHLEQVLLIPLVATQVLDLVWDTFVPFLRRKRRERKIRKQIERRRMEKEFAFVHGEEYVEYIRRRGCCGCFCTCCCCCRYDPPPIPPAREQRHQYHHLGGGDGGGGYGNSNSAASESKQKTKDARGSPAGMMQTTRKLVLSVTKEPSVAETEREKLGEIVSSTRDRVEGGGSGNGGGGRRERGRGQRSRRKGRRRDSSSSSRSSRSSSSRRAARSKNGSLERDTSAKKKREEEKEAARDGGTSAKASSTGRSPSPPPALGPPSPSAATASSAKVRKASIDVTRVKDEVDGVMASSPPKRRVQVSEGEEESSGGGGDSRQKLRAAGGGKDARNQGNGGGAKDGSEGGEAAGGAGESGSGEEGLAKKVVEREGHQLPTELEGGGSQTGSGAVDGRNVNENEEVAAQPSPEHQRPSGEGQDEKVSGKVDIGPRAGTSSGGGGGEDEGGGGGKERGGAANSEEKGGGGEQTPGATVSSAATRDHYSRGREKERSGRGSGGPRRGGDRGSEEQAAAANDGGDITSSKKGKGDKKSAGGKTGGKAGGEGGGSARQSTAPNRALADHVPVAAAAAAAAMAVEMHYRKTLLQSVGGDGGSSTGNGGGVGSNESPPRHRRRRSKRRHHRHRRRQDPHHHQYLLDEMREPELGATGTIALEIARTIRSLRSVEAAIEVRVDPNDEEEEEEEEEEDGDDDEEEEEEEELGDAAVGGKKSNKEEGGVGSKGMAVRRKEGYERSGRRRRRSPGSTPKRAGGKAGRTRERGKENGQRGVGDYDDAMGSEKAAAAAAASTRPPPLALPPRPPRVGGGLAFGRGGSKSKREEAAVCAVIDVWRLREGDERYHDDIVIESNLPEYSTFVDLSDMIVQFGFVAMFSVVWPWAALTAFLNNQLEVRGDAFKLCFGSRRPVPRRVTGIGEWETPLRVQVFVSVLAVSALITFGTGELESFYPPCNSGKRRDHPHPGASNMTPDFHCLSSRALRVCVLFVLQNVAYCLIWALWKAIPSVPSWVKHATRELGNRARARMMAEV